MRNFANDRPEPNRINLLIFISHENTSDSNHMQIIDQMHNFRVFVIKVHQLNSLE